MISHTMEDGNECPIAFASWTLLPSEKNYAQVEKEALSLIFGVSKFHVYLYGQPFTLITNHKPLTSIFGSKKDVPTIAATRLQHWALKLSAYLYTIQFWRTEKHSNADGLSQLPLHHVSIMAHTPTPAVFNLQQLNSLPVTEAKMAKVTWTDRVLSRVYQYVLRGWPKTVDASLSPLAHKRDELTVEGGCILWGMRVVVPEKLREFLLRELHRDLPGTVRMKHIAQSYLWWPGLDNQIEALAKSFGDCQAVKGSPPVAPLHPWEWPLRVFQRLHLDFAGPF